MLNQTKTTETSRLIRCDIADETYGLDMFWVRSIQRTERFRRNPEAEGPSTPRQARDDASSGRSPSTSRRGESVEPSGHSPVGWLPDERGDIPVFSLASRLGRPSEKGSALQRIVVLDPPHEWGGVEGGQPWALLVDRVSRVIQVPADRVVPLPPIVVNPSADYFQGVIKLDEELILFLAPERLHPDASLPPAPPQAGGSEGRPQAGGSEGRPQAEGSEGRPQAEGSEGEAREAASPSSRPPTVGAGGQRRSHGQIVVFSIAESHPAEQTLSFGLSISQVPEILQSLPMIPVPAAPAFVLGLVNWRGRPVPVIDLARRLGLAPEAAPSANGRTHLIIARDKSDVLPVPNPAEGDSSKEQSNQGALVGFPVRPAIRVLRLPIAHRPCRRTLPLDQTLTRGIAELENETLVVPDIRGILRQGG
jgi:chemotaxis signal transduction protein